MVKERSRQEPQSGAYLIPKQHVEHWWVVIICETTFWKGAHLCNLHLSCVGFQYPKATGKYDHPWIKAMPPGKARLYDVGYMAVTTLLAGVAAYGMFETARGSYFILAASKKRASVSTLAGFYGHALMQPCVMAVWLS